MKITNISGIIPFTYKDLKIPANGKTLILTGKNGCGKTKLLESLDDILNKIFKRPNLIQNPSKREIELDRQLKSTLKYLESSYIDIDEIDYNGVKETSQSYYSDYHSDNNILKRHIHNNTVSELLSKLKSTREEINSHLTAELREGDIKKISTTIEFDKIEIEHSPAVLVFFNASRSSSVHPVNSVNPIDQEKENIKKRIRQQRRKDRDGENGAGDYIERLLANWEVQCALEERENNYEESKKIVSWKNKLVEALKILLDDESTTLNFNSKTLSYTIHQDDRFEFTFRDLSSGYSAILKVFSELLMRTELSDHSPETIDGFVIIDEIDAHLHPSLQRKVLPFLTNVFSNLQFIVSTHSPFVINSDHDIVVYDLSQNTALDTTEMDLRYFTTDIISESLLNVSNKSQWLINKLETLTQSEDIVELKSLVQELEPVISILDDEARTYYYQAQHRILNSEKNNSNV